jgi:transposase
MKEYKVYKEIKQLKEKGFKRNSVATQLGLNWRTVARYWEMDVEEYEQEQQANHGKLLDDYGKIIRVWIEEYPTVSAAQICDWLKEHYGAEYQERTVSRYVKELREIHNLPKKAESRSYEAVEDMPPGKQIQADFGEKWMVSVTSGRVKVRFAAFVLSCSRYKYIEFQNRPFTSVDMVRACRNCFSYMGGIPHEIVFDQDSIMSVSENYGDVIHTYEFEKLRQECKFDVYLCRKSDPESKGKIESVVKFVKQNFMENRVYSDDETLNWCGLEWLDRTGNSKIHGTTRQIPAEAFETEREFLRPLPSAVITGNESICRTVRKDNTILYDSNRYSVPLGTYGVQKEVLIEPKDGILRISTTFGDFICEHMISSSRGMLIKNQNHGRSREEKLDRLLEKADALFDYEVSDFLRRIRIDKNRYARDQFALLETLSVKYGKTPTVEAIHICEQMNLDSAVDVKDYLKNFVPLPEIPLPKIPVSDRKYHVAAEKRSIDVYVKAGGGSQ